MLVLSRKQRQEVVIDDNIVVTVLEVRGNRVKLGIESPAEVSIRRTELSPFTRPLRRGVFQPHDACCVK